MSRLIGLPSFDIQRPLKSMTPVCGLRFDCRAKAPERGELELLHTVLCQIILRRWLLEVHLYQLPDSRELVRGRWQSCL